MRLLTTFDSESLARRLGDYLVTRDVENQIEEEDGTWELWVRSDDQIPVAHEALQRFQADPEDKEFTDRAAEAERKRIQERKAAERYHKRVRDGRLATARTQSGPSALTITLIGICVMIGAFTGFQASFEVLEPLYISNPTWSNAANLPEVRNGEIWRLITPALMHGDPLHLFFNMYWLFILGGAIEQRAGIKFYAGLCLMIAITSNLLQYYMVGPSFLGMSGVVYGQFGFIWVMSKRAPLSGYFIDPFTVNLMLFFFLLGFSGALGGVANFVHAAGLAVGVGAGFLNSLRLR